MRRYALEHGVREADIFIDDNGVNTEATVRDTVPLLRRWGARRVLAVSHFYHLPRIKLAYQRAGIDVFTVPSRQGHLLSQMLYNMARRSRRLLELLFPGKTCGLTPLSAALVFLFFILA